jgi:hypothetical protein
MNKNIITFLTYATYYLIYTFNKRTLIWQDIEWSVRRSYTTVSFPGPTLWSGANVWIDINNFMRFQITQDADQKWRSGQICSLPIFLYGNFSYDVEGAVDKFDPTTVLGMYVVDSDSISVNNNEIDIEIAKWSIDTPTRENIWFVVRGGDTKTFQRTYNSTRFTLNSNLSTHSFVWNSGNIHFTSFEGSMMQPGREIYSWNFIPNNTAQIPQVDCRVCINFWNHRGNVPFNKQPNNVIVHSVLHRLSKNEFGNINNCQYSIPENLKQLIPELHKQIDDKIQTCVKPYIPIPFTGYSVIEQEMHYLARAMFKNKLDISEINSMDIQNIDDPTMNQVMSNIKTITNNFKQYPDLLNMTVSFDNSGNIQLRSAANLVTVNTWIILIILILYKVL